MTVMGHMQHDTNDRDPETHRRVFMLQMDAVSFPFIEENLDQLPNLRKLIQESRLVKTKTTSHAIRASAWASFASASHPGDHGQYFPLQWDPTTMTMRRAISPSWRNRMGYEPFWYDLGRAGYKVIALDPNEIFRHPNPPVLEISNWSSQESGQAFSSDPAVLSQLRRRFGSRPIGKEVPVSKTLRHKEHMRDRLISAVEKKCDAIMWLAQEKPWDLFIGGVYDLHRAGHNLWPGGDDVDDQTTPEGALLDVFKAFDAKLADILGMLDLSNTALIVYSLHGMKYNAAQNHLMPEIMRRLNKLYLETELNMTQAPPKQSLTAYLRRIVPSKVQFVAASILGERVQDWVVGREFHGSLNWGETVAFALPAGDQGYIRFNIEGREAKGLLPASDNAVTHLVEWMKERFRELEVVETGEPLVERIDLSDDVFPGPRTHMLPDMIVNWRPEVPVTKVRSDTIGTVEGVLKTGRYGNHSDESFALLSGNLPQKESCLSLQSITDYKTFVKDLLM